MFRPHSRDEGIGRRPSPAVPFWSNVRVFVQMERVLLEQNRLRDEKKLLEDSLVLKDKALQLQQQIAAQNKVGDPDAGRVEESTSVAFNHIYVGSRQKYELSCYRKDGQEREGGPRQYN